MPRLFRPAEPHVGDPGSPRESDLAVHDEEPAVRPVIEGIEHPGSEGVEELDETPGFAHGRDVPGGELYTRSEGV